MLFISFSVCHVFRSDTSTNFWYSRHQSSLLMNLFYLSINPLRVSDFIQKTSSLCATKKNCFKANKCWVKSHLRFILENNGILCTKVIFWFLCDWFIYTSFKVRRFQQYFSACYKNTRHFIASCLFFEGRPMAVFSELFSLTVAHVVKMLYNLFCILFDTNYSYKLKTAVMWIYAIKKNCRTIQNSHFVVHWRVRGFFSYFLPRYCTSMELFPVVRTDQCMSSIC